jgi:hypothetical protein
LKKFYSFYEYLHAYQQFDLKDPNPSGIPVHIFSKLEKHFLGTLVPELEGCTANETVVISVYGAVPIELGRIVTQSWMNSRIAVYNWVKEATKMA